VATKAISPQLTVERLDLFQQEIAAQLLRHRGKVESAEPGQAHPGPEAGVPGPDHVGAPQQRTEGVLGPRPLGDHLRTKRGAYPVVATSRSGVSSGGKRCAGCGEIAISQTLSR
jgi:hypothetical protein